MANFTKHKKYIFKIIQLILGTIFVFSGFIKGIDPVGVSFKVKEYFSTFGFEELSDRSLFFAVAMCTVEIFIGGMLLIGVYRKLFSFMALIFLSLFTAITFYLYTTPTAVIQECGCFGDAIHLTNAETFYKNIFFIILSILYFRRQFVTNNVTSSSSKLGIDLGLTFSVLLLSISIPIYSLIYLPPFDFLPFNKGVNILENSNKLNHRNENEKIHLIYKNKQSGDLKKFQLTDTTWKDTTVWEYVDTEIPKTKRDKIRSRFVLMDENRNDFTSTVFDDSDYNFIIIARNIEDLRKKDFQKVSPLYELHKDGSINLYLFTSSEISKTKNILASHGLNIDVYNVDEVTLKSMIRNERGVMLVSRGVISGKWNLKQNSFESLNDRKLTALVARERTTNIIYTIILLVLVSVLILGIVKYKKKGDNGTESN